MKNLKKFISIALILCTTLTLLSGCGDIANILHSGREELPKTAVAIVLGAHKNFPAANLSLLYEPIYQACASCGTVSATVADGDGQLVFDESIPKPKADVDREKQLSLAEKNAKNLLHNLSAAAAKAPETDLLQSVSLSRDLLASKEAPKKELIIIDSGLSTAGFLNFAASNLIEQDPDIIVSQLQDRHAIPDMSEIDVTIYGLGQCCGAQPRLTADYAAKLQQIWLAILNAAGCRSIEISPAPLGTSEPEGPLPEVSCVPVTTSDPLTFTAQATAPESIPDTIRLDEAAIAFPGDSAEPLAPAKAAEAVAPIAEVLCASPATSILVAGMTAGAGDGLKLSRERAEAVKALLVDSGVQEDQITCIGLGSKSNCLRTPDLDSDGNLIEQQARKNRAVFILRQDGPTAQLLLSQIGEVL